MGSKTVAPSHPTLSVWNPGKCSTDMFNAYIGLEMAMALVQLNSIEDYWRNEKFAGHHDFQSVMSQDHFQKI